MYIITLIITLQNGEKDDDDEEEEGDVEYDAVDLGVISVWRLQLVSDTAAGAHAFVQVEHEALDTEEEKVSK